MSLLSRIPYFLRNKFLLATAGFVAWMLFFDRNDLFTQRERKKELHQIEESKRYYARQIAENRAFSKSLQFNASAVEKYVREVYLMKRDNEDLFLVAPLPAK